MPRQIFSGRTFESAPADKKVVLSGSVGAARVEQYDD